MRRRLLLIHPYVPAYRVPVYSRLVAALAETGIDAVIAQSPPPPALAARSDAATADWAEPIPTTWIRVRGRDVAIRRTGDLLRRHRPDLIIVEQAVKNIETYALLARQHLDGPPVALWGHGRSFSSPQGPALAGLKQFLTRRASWFFAYTQAGADHVVDHGFPSTRITVLNNTIDTEDLAFHLDSLTQSDVDAFRAAHGLTPGRTALFIGGVDDAKGINFLMEAARATAERLPGFVLLVGGSGDAVGAVQSAAASGSPVRYLGRVDGRSKAVALRAADLLAIPQAIGLVAVDSLVAGRPIVSTTHPWHGPESGYLEDGRTALFTEHDPSEYARALVALLNDAVRLSALGQACRGHSMHYSVDGMSTAFLDGIIAWDDVCRAGLA
jgi:glycosyltransferase involved in cell wall biosynthesis